MPTNRNRRTRPRVCADGLTNDAYIYFKWDATIGGWATDRSEDEILAYWKMNRAAIMTRYMEDMRKKRFAGKRPSFYLDELEAIKPRRKMGKEKWIGPVRNDGGDRTIIEDKYETDFQYLKRLNLLEPWEAAKGAHKQE